MMGMNGGRLDSGRQVDDDGDEEAEDPQPSMPLPSVGPKRAKRSDAGVAKPHMSGKPHISKWQNKEADLQWGEILQDLQDRGQTAHEMKIYISVEENGQVQKMLELEGASVMGEDGSPSDALTNKIIDCVHLPSGYPGPRKYVVRFLWKSNSNVYGIGFCNLPSAQQIMRMRAQKIAENTDFSPMPTGMGRPQPQYPPQYGQPQQSPPDWRMYPPTPYGYGYPMPPPQESPELIELRSQLAREREDSARQKGMLEEILRAQKEGRAPNLQQTSAGLGAVPPPPVDVSAAIQKGIIDGLALISGGKGLGAQQRSGLEESMTKTTNTLIEGMMNAAMKMVSSSMQKTITGLGSPQEEEDEVIPAEVVPPPDPKAGLPFETIELDQKWPDGSKVGYARSKETGNIHPLGAIMSNPYVMAKGGEAVAKLAETLTDAIKHVGMAGPHVVHRIPDAAQAAGIAAPAPAMPIPVPTESDLGGGWGS